MSILSFLCYLRGEELRYLDYSTLRSLTSQNEAQRYPDTILMTCTW
jgi:hypothetical protein